MNKFRNAFGLWEQVTGITYIEVSDDGADMPYNPGSAGNRGDVRIGGRSIDGPGGILGYNYYPAQGGDMILDTDDIALFSVPTYNYGNLRNVVSHEHGHGIGLGHVIPEDCTKLMEATHCPPNRFVGPQDDDIRGGMRNYGDPYENNDANTEPSNLGTLVDSLVVENLSIDNGRTDVDWYLITLTGIGVRIEVDPVGSTYLLGNEGGSTSPISTDSISDPDIELYDALGVSLLKSATSAGIGATEVLTCPVPSIADYQIRVYRKEGTGGDVQRYTMSIYDDSLASLPLTYGEILPKSDLAFSVHPNPFSLETRARFLAPSAGSYTIEVFDASGRLSRTIAGHVVSPGWGEALWDGCDHRGREASSGMYFIRVTLGNKRETRRVLLVR
jgi:hypothetical protein